MGVIRAFNKGMRNVYLLRLIIACSAFLTGEAWGATTVPETPSAQAFVQIFGCSLDCPAEGFDLPEILARIRGLYPHPQRIDDNFPHHQLMSPMNRLVRSLFKASPDENRQLADFLNQSIAGNVLQVAKRPIESEASRLEQLQLVYYWYFLTFNLDPTSIAKYEAPFESLELKSESYRGGRPDNFFVALKLCEIRKSADCRQLAEGFFAAEQRRIRGASFVQLINLSLAYASIFDKHIHQKPNPIFASAFKTRQTLERLAKFASIFKMKNNSCRENFEECQDLTFHLLAARDQTNLATNLFDDLLFLIKDRAYEILNDPAQLRRLKEAHDVERVGDWLRAIEIEPLFERKAEKGFIDDVSDGLNLLRDEGVLNTETWSKLFTLAGRKFVGKEKTPAPVSVRQTKFATLSEGIELYKLSDQIAGQDGRALGIMYVWNIKQTLRYEVELKQQGQKGFFENEDEQTIFSAMGIMANNSNTGPSWATGSTGQILSEYWSPKRDGILVLGDKENPLQILRSQEFIQNVAKRRQLQRDLLEKQIQFYSLGQLYLFDGQNLVSPSMKSSGGLSQNILAQDDGGRAAFFKFYSMDSYSATELIKGLGFKRAFNMDAQSAQYDYHVTSDGEIRGTPGIEYIAYSKFSVKALNPVFKKQNRKCTAISQCELKAYIEKISSAK